MPSWHVADAYFDRDGGRQFKRTICGSGLSNIYLNESKEAIQLNEEYGSKLLAVHVSGKLTAADYEHFVPEFERLVGLHGKLNVLFDMHGFHGWTAGALWADTKFAMHHFSDINRLAVVGETKWQEGMATFCKPFTKATVKYFDHADATEARKWLGEV